MYLCPRCTTTVRVAISWYACVISKRYMHAYYLWEDSEQIKDMRQSPKKSMCEYMLTSVYAHTHTHIYIHTRIKNTNVRLWRKFHSPPGRSTCMKQCVHTYAKLYLYNEIRHSPDRIFIMSRPKHSGFPLRIHVHGMCVRTYDYVHVYACVYLCVYVCMNACIRSV